jgi:hypothetical protein
MPALMYSPAPERLAAVSWSTIRVPNSTALGSLFIVSFLNDFEGFVEHRLVGVWILFPHELWLAGEGVLCFGYAFAFFVQVVLYICCFCACGRVVVLCDTVACW